MKFAIITFKDANEIVNGTGTVYGWYESLATALNTATNLRQWNKAFHTTVVRLV